MWLTCIFILLVIINSNFNLCMVCILSNKFDHFLCFSYLNSSDTYQLMLQLLHNCLLMFSVLCWTVYFCIYSCMLFMFTILCVYVLSCVETFQIQLSYNKYWIFLSICMYVCMYVCTYIRTYIHTYVRTYVRTYIH